MAGELLYSEQVSALVTPQTRARLDAVSTRRRDAGVEWPHYSLGAVVRDAIDAGLDMIERDSMIGATS